MEVVVGILVVRMIPKPLPPPLDPAIETKLLSIEAGEPHLVDALIQLCLSRSTPDPQRARALRMLGARADERTFGRVLSQVARRCGYETCEEILRQAERFPEPAALERAAVGIVRGTHDRELRRAALHALEVIEARRERMRGAVSRPIEDDAGQLALIDRSDRPAGR